MLEIYKEMLKDLLVPNSGVLKIKQNPIRGIYVEGLHEECVVSIEELFGVIEAG